MNQTNMKSKLTSNYVNVTSDDMKTLSSSRFALDHSRECSKERMNTQYEETQRALEKYKQHSQTYFAEQKSVRSSLKFLNSKSLNSLAVSAVMELSLRDGLHISSGDFKQSSF